ncbi:hypothetical protein UA08_09016 [Talaromyces atroroseus]|uniref:Uncharacterized protein n=1 Tax=Talaromyces atroroseus TaxID=1441469 RepID=A0A1Q5Q7J9_TALAT|nr:hypothetical protein UA08_09016 [Talaromyces atroroseus]OKL55753.1 hypothetical protein UA08_09016 [Talaromyces atroroseus]
MAFRLPTQAPPRRLTLTSEPAIHTPQHLEPNDNNDDEAKEWILFSPSQAASHTTRTRSDSTERTARTAGQSRLSDFGSFNAITHDNSGDNPSVDVLDEEATELDSLDDGLHDFRDGNYPVLPTHDGLGSFLASGQQTQEQLWRYEQYNPQRTAVHATPTRRSSLQNHLEAVDEQESRADRERWQRIERWRTEQSRILLQEIERETRRHQRRSSRSTSRRSRNDILDSISETKAMENTSSISSSSQGDSPKESIWRRITRKVIRDLIGIDDSLLSIILGESLVDDVHLTSYIDDDSHPDIREMQEAIRDVPETPIHADGNHTWQEQLIQRIARELGVLVHQIWEHPGAFSSYMRSSEEPTDFYAGIPVTRPESAPRFGIDSSSQITPEENMTSSVSSPHFTPTLQDPATADLVAQWGIEDDEMVPGAQSQSNGLYEPVSASTLAAQEYDYWEQDIDVTMIFRYLKNRFRRDTPTMTTATTNSGNGNTTAGGHSTHNEDEQDTYSSRRAAVIRQHHPLVARAHARSQARQSGAAAAAGGGGGGGLRTQMRAAGISTPTSPISRHRFRRPSSSYASQSTKVSATRRTAALGSGSSRHYWDIGGSVGSSSAAVSVGGPAVTGAWGEV